MLGVLMLLLQEEDNKEELEYDEAIISNSSRSVLYCFYPISCPGERGLWACCIFVFLSGSVRMMNAVGESGRCRPAPEEELVRKFTKKPFVTSAVFMLYLTVRMISVNPEMFPEMFVWCCLDFVTKFHHKMKLLASPFGRWRNKHLSLTNFCL